MPDDEPDTLEYYAGGVPTGEIFRSTVDEIRTLSQADAKETGGLNRLQELCFIGLIAHFEAFCKDHFASIINLDPLLIESLKAAGLDVSADASHVALFGDRASHRLGFLLASKYDFGTPKKVNALFNAVLKITPFAKAEATTFDGILRDRNLLLHHGGTYTPMYIEQALRRKPGVGDAFYDSRVVGKADVLATAAFLEDVGRKLVRASYKRLAEHVKQSGAQWSLKRRKALDLMEWWGDSSA